ncbi:MAG: endonuclease, partial [Tenericutes bacterium]
MLAIYQVKNIENEKIYIGSTKDTDQRWDTHKRCLRGNSHVNPHLQYA